MSKKYDGWCVKENEEIFYWTFQERKSDVINKWGRIYWERDKKRHGYKIVKVKLVEVE